MAAQQRAGETNLEPMKRSTWIDSNKVSQSDDHGAPAD
jgi:hypothetical protein